MAFAHIRVDDVDSGHYLFLAAAASAVIFRADGASSRGM